MKKYLLIFFCIFVLIFSFSPLTNSQTEPLESSGIAPINVAGLKQAGINPERLADLLKHPPWSTQPHISSWINELLALNDPNIDDHLVQLLAQDRWLKPSPQKDVLQWIETLIRRELADNEEFITMLEAEPWKQLFLVSDLATATHREIAKNGRNLRTAIGHAFVKVLTTHFDHLKHDRNLFAWIVILLTEWENENFESELNKSFGSEYYENSGRQLEKAFRETWHQKKSDNIDKLIKFLLTKKVDNNNTDRTGKTILLSRLLFLKLIPVSKNPHLFNWLFEGVRQHISHLSYSSHIDTEFIYNFERWHLLNNGHDSIHPEVNRHTLHFRYSNEIVNEFINTLERYVLGYNTNKEGHIETILQIIDILLQKKENYQPHVQKYVEDTKFADILTHLAVGIGFNDSRIQERAGLILENANLPFEKVVLLLQQPGWREHPNALKLLKKLIQPPLMYDSLGQIYPYPFLNSWDERKVETLLAEPFWHSQLEGTFGRRFFGIGPFKPVTLRNAFQNSLCISALSTKQKSVIRNDVLPQFRGCPLFR